MLFSQLNHFQPAAAVQNANLTWMDYKFIHVPRKGCLGFILFALLWQIFNVKTRWGWSFQRNELLSLISREDSSGRPIENPRHPFLGS